jgi:superfamily I DNA/RNA helicase
MLSTDTEGEGKDDKADSPVSSVVRSNTNDAMEADRQKVTITTVHAAKGLEWPVVFIPAGELNRARARGHLAHSTSRTRHIPFLSLHRDRRDR